MGSAMLHARMVGVFGDAAIRARFCVGTDSDHHCCLFVMRRVRGVQRRKLGNQHLPTHQSQQASVGYATHYHSRLNHPFSTRIMASDGSDGANLGLTAEGLVMIGSEDCPAGTPVVKGCVS
jgi:hypothetical protein